MRRACTSLAMHHWSVPGVTAAMAALVLLFPSLLPAQTTQTPPPSAATSEDAAGRIDPFADQIIGDTADFLTSAKELHLKAELSFDKLLPSGHKMQLSRSVEIWLRRPDRLRAEVVGDNGRRRLFYDGKTLSMHHLAQNVYSVVDVPETFDGMVDFVRQRFDLSIPLADLLVSDVYENFSRNTTGGVYAGLHYLGGDLHHHLLLSNASVDYQVWVEDSATPLPRKIVITYANEAGAPQLTAHIGTWDFAPRLSDSIFEFRPPADADEIDVLLAPGDNNETRGK